MKPILTTLIFLVIMLSATQADDSTTVKKRSHYGGIHFAGNTGLLSVNAGWKFSRFQVGAGYGYLPEIINGAEVHSIIIKTSYNFSKGIFNKNARWYTGFNTIYGITHNTFVKLPSHYPEKYYAPNAIHFSPFIGLSLPLSFYKPVWADKVTFNIELGALDSYLWYHILNKELSFWDICNLSYGIYYHF